VTRGKSAETRRSIEIRNEGDDGSKKWRAEKIGAPESCETTGTEKSYEAQQKQAAVGRARPRPISVAPRLFAYRSAGEPGPEYPLATSDRLPDVKVSDVPSGPRVLVNVKVVIESAKELRTCRDSPDNLLGPTSTGGIWAGAGAAGAQGRSCKNFYWENDVDSGKIRAP